LQRGQGRVGGAMESEDQLTSLTFRYHENELYNNEASCGKIWRRRRPRRMAPLPPR
jgi:hypothetical protein